MADEDLVIKLKNEPREEWNRWRQDSTDILDLSEADLYNADLREADLSRANLSEANLNGADLGGVDLGGANLIKANLSRADIINGAYLVGADLREAILSGANLSGADLTGANLVIADLRGADLMGTDLSGSNLTGADLSDANLSGASLRNASLGDVNFSGATMNHADLSNTLVVNAIFGNVDLSGTIGLDSMTHIGPSTIGIDTLFASRGKISEIFLRGAGVPEELIAYIPSLVGRAIEFYSCFISYSHADAAFARRLHDTLQGRGIRCWLDEHQLLPGHNIYDEIDRGIKLWDKVLLCCSKSALSSWWVDNEVDKAFAKEQSLWKERGEKVLALIPLNLDGALFNWQDGKANAVLQRKAADFTDWESSNTKFEHGVESLVKALRAHDGGREKPPKPLL